MQLCVGLGVPWSSARLTPVRPLAPVPLESSLDCRGEQVCCPHGAEGGFGVCFQGEGGTGQCQAVWPMHQLGLDETPQTLGLLKQERVEVPKCAPLPGQRAHFPSHPESHGHSVAVMCEGWSRTQLPPWKWGSELPTGNSH